MSNNKKLIEKIANNFEVSPYKAKKIIEKFVTTLNEVLFENEEVYLNKFLNIKIVEYKAIKKCWTIKCKKTRALKRALQKKEFKNAK